MAPRSHDRHTTGGPHVALYVLMPLALSPRLSPPLHSLSLVASKDRVPPTPGKGIAVLFVTPEGDRVPVEAAEGDNLLDLAHANNVELEGACEGSLACSTCHVILEPAVYSQLPEPTDEENDMLDLAFGLTETSRLGCQVVVTPALRGMTVRLPSATRNMAVDGYKPKPH